MTASSTLTADFFGFGFQWQNDTPPLALKHMAAAIDANNITSGGTVVSGAVMVMSGELLIPFNGIEVVASGGGILVGSGGAIDLLQGGVVQVSSGGAVQALQGGEFQVTSGGTSSVFNGGSFVVASGGRAIIGSAGSLDIIGIENVLSGGSLVVAPGGLAFAVSGGTIGATSGGTIQVTSGGSMVLNAGAALIQAVPKANYAANNASASATVTVAQFATADELNVIDMTGSLSGGGNLTTPTLAAIQAQNPNLTLNSGFVVRVMNHSAGNFAWTFLAGTSIVTNGTSTVAQNTWRDFSFIITAGTTATLQDIGGGNIV